jgi:hypothetical protein
VRFSLTRSFLVSACLVTAICTGAALAQSPVAYVYVAQQGPDQYTSGPIAVYAASSAGQLSQISGSPFTETTGFIIGTTGSHFLTVDENSETSDQYLHSYSATSNGAIGEEQSKVDLHEWCAMDRGGLLDHTGKFVYVLDADDCGGNLQSFSISKTGQLTFIGNTGSTAQNAAIFWLPVLAGNDMFGYTWNNASDTACQNYVFSPMARESSGALFNTSFTETDPAPPAGDMAFQEFPGLATDDPTNHLATMVYFATDSGACDETAPQLASYTVESNGDLVSTNTYQNMPYLAQVPNFKMVLNPAGNILAVSVGTGIQFFHFNGAAPITTFTGVIGTSGYISTMSWDTDNHLYALNALSGRLHVYTATTTSVVEAAGSPYNLPYCGYAHNNSNCPQTLIVRRIP